MKKENVTSRMAVYISEQGYRTEEIARATGIPESKLRPETKRDLDAAEFLELCRYLRIRPEDFR